MTSRQALSTAEGFTHASNVIAVVRCKEAASGIVTFALVPLNESAFPYLPNVVHVAPLIAPLCPLPEASAAVVPEFSSKPYAATRVDAPACVVALATFEVGPRLPAASIARTW